MQRIERVQEKFLIWLCARCRVSEASFDYCDLTAYFKVNTITARHEQHDIMFIRNIHRNSVWSSFLLEMFSSLYRPVNSAFSLCLLSHSRV